MDKSNYYYCYSSPLYYFLEHTNNIKSIKNMNGKHPKTNKDFWVFKRNKSLDECLTRWKLNKIKAIESIKNGSIKF